jgi:hypothetical protein
MTFCHFEQYFVDLAHPSLSHVRAGPISTQNNWPITADEYCLDMEPRSQHAAIHTA